MSKAPLYTRSWFLTAGETDAQGCMPVTLIVARMIEVATLHANALGIGYSALAEHRLGWVLARFTIEINRYPVINEEYSMSTWIEGYNRYFSDRCAEMYDSAGNIIARIRSVWVAIDTEKRTMADLTELERDSFPTLDRVCPVAKCRTPALASESVTRSSAWTPSFCDIDFNRHVNTVRYIGAVLDTYDMATFDANEISSLEASFDHECHYNDNLTLITGTSRRDSETEVTVITRPDNTAAVSVGIRLRPRSANKIS